MLIKSFNIILISILSMLFFIILQEPYELNNLNYELDVKRLSAEEITAYEIDEKLLRRAYAKQYYKQQNEDILLDFELFAPDKSLSAKKASKKADVLELSENVEYKEKDISFKTQYLKYLIKDKILSSNVKSQISSQSLNASAASFSYDLEKKQLNTQGVQVCINE